MYLYFPDTPRILQEIATQYTTKKKSLIIGCFKRFGEVNNLSRFHVIPEDCSPLKYVRYLITKNVFKSVLSLSVFLVIFVTSHFASTSVKPQKLTLISRVLLNRITFLFPRLALHPNTGYGLLIGKVSRSHSTTHHRR
jgi:hypothetical protein